MTRTSRPAARRHPHQRGARRPTGGHRRTSLLRARRGQEHLRHRQLPGAQHRHGTGPLAARPSHHRGVQFGDSPAVYALEGSIAVTGSAVQWLRDQMKIMSSAPESETLARTVEDNGGMYFVPAFSGLFAPYWRSDARGAIVGLARYNDNGHLARATLEAICYQSRDVVEAMEQDSGVHLDVLKVDGGVTANDLCMQIQADVLGARSAARSSPRPPRSAPPTRQGWPPVSRRTPTNCAPTGRSRNAGSRSGPRTNERRATRAGSRPWNARSTGSRSSRAAPPLRCPRHAARGRGGTGERQQHAVMPLVGSGSGSARDRRAGRSAMRRRALIRGTAWRTWCCSTRRGTRGPGLAEMSLPAPGQGQVQVRIDAIGLNRADTLFRAGGYYYQPTLPRLPAGQ